jgi:ATP-dependent helicase STH1/SNF2
MHDVQTPVLAADALDTLLRAGISPSDPRVRTLAALVHFSAKLPPTPAAQANVPDASEDDASSRRPRLHATLSGSTERVLRFELGQRAMSAAVASDPFSVSPWIAEGNARATSSAAPNPPKQDVPSAFAAARDASGALHGDGNHDTVRASTLFRIRAQVAAYRSLARLQDPSPEVLVAAAGGRRLRPITSQALSAAELAQASPHDLSALEAQRGMRLKARRAARNAELAKVPTPLPRDLGNQVLIEKKSLAVLELQREVRKQVTSIMRGVLQVEDPIDLGGGVPAFRRPAPKLYYADASTASGTKLASALGPEAMARIKALEKKHREEQNELRLRKGAEFAARMVAHAAVVRASKQARQQLDKKLFKEIDRHFRDKIREEDRRKRKEQQDRLRALRNNDEDEYLELLRNTKNERLLQVLRQTDEYLSLLGAKVEAQKEAALAEDLAEAVRKGSGEPSQDIFTKDEEASRDASVDEKGEKDSVEAMRARRNQYYTITHKIKEGVKQPSILVGGKLKPYQIDGLEWMVSLYNNGLNGILADEMGLGKTIQTLSLLTYLVEFKNNKGPFLVIVPLSTVSNWVRELEAWAPSLGKVVYRGAPDRRKELQQDMVAGDYNVVLTTYEFVVKDKLFLGKVKWKYIIIDEGHRMKNADCKLALTLGAKYKTRNRILLTGTPLQNNLTELWALLNFLLPTIFSSADTFETWFNAPFQASSLSGGAELNEEEQLLVISRLHQVLRPFMLRRLKTDVETQLPEKVESVLRCDMSIWQKILYSQMTSNIGIMSLGSVRTFNNIVMQLKKVCNHPYLFYTDEELASVPRDYIVRAAGKFEMLEHALTKLRATGHRVLLFSQMTAALDYLEYFLSGMGVRHMRLDGTTKADDRQGMLENFNAPDSEYFIFLLSTRAGGLGLNLQTADTVFIFDSDWNPMMDLQAQDRAHRIGQTKEVRVFRLITASSVEEKILERANRKLQMDAQIIQAGQFNNQSSDTDRTQMLKEILQSQAKGGPDEDEVPPLEELNRLLARTDEEFDIFQEMDRVRLLKEAAEGNPRLLTKESELPSWVLKPELTQKQQDRAKADEIEYDANGRSRRKRTEVTYNDGLTDKEWAEAVERDGDAGRAAELKRQRLNDGPSEARSSGDY